MHALRLLAALLSALFQASDTSDFQALQLSSETVNKIRMGHGASDSNQIGMRQGAMSTIATTVAGNGYAGLNVVPRWATLIYYNCDLPACTTQEWIDTSAGQGTFTDLLNNARDTAIRNLFGLHWDP